MTSENSDDYNIELLSCERFKNFSEWDKESLHHFREVLEETLDEVHDRERQIFNRAGALLSLNGFILTLIATFAVKNDFEGAITNSLAIGIFLIVVSSVIIGWSIVPNYRCIINPSSGDVIVNDYWTLRDNPDALYAKITAERAGIVEETGKYVTKSSTWLGHGMCILIVGMIFIGLAMIMALIGVFVALYIVFAFIVLICCFIMEKRNISKKL